MNATIREGEDEMNIAVFFYNRLIKDVDCSNPIDGNPGIGGTEYCILCFCQLMKIYHPEHRVVLITPEEGRMPEVDDHLVVSQIQDVPKECAKRGIDILLVSSVLNGSPLQESFFANADKEKVKVITWGHNYYLADYCNLLAQHSCVKANVFVGKQQYDRYIDHKVIEKSTYIYNMYPSHEKHNERNLEEHIVTYIGSLVPQKGFHLLAKSWKKILESVPDAQLYVIGSGKLYNRNAKLGPFGIAEENYEKSFMDALMTDDNNILPSVHFLGTVGQEKDAYIEKTSVGVVNPSGRTETFGLSALDFESQRVPVVTIAKGGFLDTVISGETGYLYNRVKDLSRYVVELLNNKEKNTKFGDRAATFSKNFNGKKIIDQWCELLTVVEKNEKPAYIPPTDNYDKDLKWLRILNRKVKDILHIKTGVAVIDIESVMRKAIRR